jgi:hypothetical protein
MKINGKGLPKGPKILNVSLPKNWKGAWPARMRYDSASFDKRYSVRTNLSPLLHDFKVKKHERILDIGAFKNEIVETLQKKGYYNAIGIDVNPEILKSPYGKRINFLDLSLNEKYRVVHFSYILSHFGEALPCYIRPSLQLFATKIYIHLLPEGYLIFRDDSPNLLKFRDLLLSIGFKKRVSKIDPKIKTMGAFVFQKH